MQDLDTLLNEYGVTDEILVKKARLADARLDAAKAVWKNNFSGNGDAASVIAIAQLLAMP